MWEWALVGELAAVLGSRSGAVERTAGLLGVGGARRARGVDRASSGGAAEGCGKEACAWGFLLGFRLIPSRTVAAHMLGYLAASPCVRY